MVRIARTRAVHDMSAPVRAGSDLALIRLLGARVTSGASAERDSPSL